MSIRIMSFMLLAILSTTCPVSAQNQKTYQENIQGTWEVTNFVGGGRVMSGFIGSKITFSSNNMTFKYDETTRRYTFKLGQAKNPKAIDLTSLDEDFKGQTIPAIYKLEGDALTLCFSNMPENTKRPTEFVSPNGSDLALITLKRVKE